MNVVLISLGSFFLLLSAIWFLAWSGSGFPAYILVQFIFLFLLGGGDIMIVVLLSAREKRKHAHIEQKIEIDGKDLVGGKRKVRELQCRNCGAGLGSKDVTLTDLGILVKCPYCGQIYTLEEEPIWYGSDRYPAP